MAKGVDIFEARSFHPVPPIIKYQNNFGKFVQVVNTLLPSEELDTESIASYVAHHPDIPDIENSLTMYCDSTASKRKALYQATLKNAKIIVDGKTQWDVSDDASNQKRFKQAKAAFEKVTSYPEKLYGLSMVVLEHILGLLNCYACYEQENISRFETTSSESMEKGTWVFEKKNATASLSFKTACYTILTSQNEHMTLNAEATGLKLCSSVQDHGPHPILTISVKVSLSFPQQGGLIEAKCRVKLYPGCSGLKYQGPQGPEVVQLANSQTLILERRRYELSAESLQKMGLKESDRGVSHSQGNTRSNDQAIVKSHHRMLGAICCCLKSNPCLWGFGHHKNKGLDRPGTTHAHTEKTPLLNRQAPAVNYQTVFREQCELPDSSSDFDSDCERHDNLQVRRVSSEGESPQLPAHLQGDIAHQWKTIQPRKSGIAESRPRTPEPQDDDTQGSSQMPPPAPRAQRYKRFFRYSLWVLCYRQVYEGVYCLYYL